MLKRSVSIVVGSLLVAAVAWFVLAQKQGTQIATSDASLDISHRKSIQESLPLHQFVIEYKGNGLRNSSVGVEGHLVEYEISNNRSLLTCSKCSITGISDPQYHETLTKSLTAGSLIEWQHPRKFLSLKGDEFWYFLALRMQFSSFVSGEIEEQSPWGKVNASYQSNSSAVNKTIAINSQKVKASVNYSAEVKTERPYFIDLHQSDTMKIPFLSQLPEAESKLRLTFTKTTQVKFSEVSEKYQALIKQNDFNLDSLKKTSRREIAEQNLEKWQLSEIVSASHAGDRRQAYSKLKSWLILNSNRQEFEQQFMSQDLDPKVENIWIRALIAVGDEPSQNLILQKLNQSLDHPKKAKFYVSSLAMLKSPSVDTINAALQLSDQQENIKSSTYLSLGAMAKQVTEESQEGREKILNRLLALLQTSSIEEDILLALGALGNAGNIDFPILAPFLRHQSEKIRVAAIKALRFSYSQDAYSYLAQNSKSFTFNERFTSLTAISYWPIGADSLKLLEQTFTSAKDQRAQVKVLVILRKYHTSKFHADYRRILEKFKDMQLSDNVAESLEKMPL